MKRVRRYVAQFCPGEVFIFTNTYGRCMYSIHVLIDHDGALIGLNVLVYKDDILVIQREMESTSDHLTKVEQVPQR